MARQNFSQSFAGRAVANGHAKALYRRWSIPGADASTEEHRTLDKAAFKEFWTSVATHWRRERGCYVFAWQHGTTYRPLYVGKTGRTFEDECFSARNHLLLNEVIAGKVGSLVLFLLKYEPTKGKFNASVNGDLEKFLVEVALVRNPDLANIKFAKQTTPRFTIRGVHHSGKGKQSKPATELKRALGL